MQAAQTARSASWRAGALAAALLLGATASAQTVVATLPTPAHELRAAGEAREAAGDLLGAAALHEAALAREPGDPHLHWRIARGLLRYGERHPELDEDRRVELYERAREWARSGRALDASCAECCLYEFATTARLASVHGIARAAGTVREAGAILEQCLANPPQWIDATGSEAASLHYGASVFFRRMPDAEWLSWAIGYKSDATRSVEHARQAVALEGSRVRYRLELGAALLCDGARRDDAALRAEGLRFVNQAASTKTRDADHAKKLAAGDPDAGCSLSLDEAEIP